MRFDFGAFWQSVAAGADRVAGKLSPNVSTALAAGGISLASLMVGYVVLFGGGASVADTEARSKTVAVTGPVFTPVVSTSTVVARVDAPSAQTESLLPPPPQDARSLTRAVQTELKRAGCYSGPVNGIWNNRTSAAMDEFTARVNARLPVDKPDAVLLALLETHDDVSCRTDKAPAEQTAETASIDRERPTVTREAVLSSSSATSDAPTRAEHLSYADDADVETASVAPEETAQARRASMVPAAVGPAPKIARRERPRRATRKARRKPSFSREVRRSFRSIQRSMRGLF